MTTELERQLSQLKQGDHICPIYGTVAEQMAVAIPFVKQGLAQGERCLYIADDRTVEQILQELAAGGVDVGHEQERGALRMLTKQDSYLKNGQFDPQGMIDFFRLAQTQALADGYSGLRLIGEMTWALGSDIGCERLIEFEALLHHFSAISRSVILCLYNRERFDPAIIHDILRTHPIAILGDQVCPNPYYEPPELVLSLEVQASDEYKRKRVDWWIEQLKRARTTELEREHALEKLRQSERRLAEAQHVAHIGSWERDLRTNEVMWSDELYSLFGLQANVNDLSYQQFLDLIVPQDVDRIRALVEGAIRVRGHFNCDYRIIRPDGSVRVLHDRGSVILDEAGEPIRLVGTAQDVTEQRGAEDALRQSEDRIRLVIDTIPVMAWSVQPDGIVDYLNQRWKDYAGLSLEQYVEEPMRPIHPEDIPRAIENWRAHMAAGEGYEDEMRLRRADGEYRWFLVRTEPLRDEQGDIVKWYGVSTDIDDRKRAEQAVKESQQLLQKVLTTLPVGVLVTDREGSVILGNPAYKHIWGDIIVSGRERWAQSKGLWHDSGKRIDPESWASARALFEGQTSLNELIDIETFEGQQKTIRNSAAPIRNAEGLIVGAVIVNEDVTEQVRAQKALRESAERLQHLSRRLLAVQEAERRHLARDLHDEVGQLLTGLRLLLNANDVAPTEEFHSRLEQARSIVDELLDKVRRLSFDLRPAVLDQLGLLPALLTLFERYTHQTGVLIDFKHSGLNKRFPPEVETNGYRIVQEALTNVARHAGVAGVTVRVWATTETLSLQIEDCGRGFDPDVVLALPQSGGLAGMQERVKLLNGRLTIDSRPGAGTHITAELPLRDRAREEKP